MIDKFLSRFVRRAADTSRGQEYKRATFFCTALASGLSGFIIGSVQLACLNCGANHNAGADSQTTINGYHLSN